MAVSKVPVVLFWSALAPVAVLAPPVSFLRSALNPIAVLLAETVALALPCSAPGPRAVLFPLHVEGQVWAATTPGRESEKMSAAKRTEKNELTLLEWLEWLNI